MNLSKMICMFLGVLRFAKKMKFLTLNGRDSSYFQGLAGVLLLYARALIGRTDAA